MPKRIPEEVVKDIDRLYNNGIGMSPAEISKQTGVPYPSVYGMTKAKQRINPETGELFGSKTEYRDYLSRQRINKNYEISDIVKRRLKKLNRNQSWLARQLGITPQAVSLYTQGRSMPRGKRLHRLMQILNIDNQTKPDSLDDLVVD